MTTNVKFNDTDILQKYMTAALKKSSGISFFILSGSQDVVKSQIVQELSRGILGQYFLNDFLYIKDFSTQLKKKHNIKIQKKDDETYKILFKEYNYKDIGTREINSWLIQSPAGNTKIVLIENMERMTIGAINAFLKTCEEPLENRIIIATTANKSQILDTILSRSVVINFTDQSHFVGQTKYNFTQDIAVITKILATDTNIYKKYSLLSEINKKGMIKPFLDKLIAHYILQNDFQNSEKRLKVKKMSLSNVNMDNLLFYGLII